MDQEHDNYADRESFDRGVPSLRVLAIIAICGVVCLFALIALFNLIVPPVPFHD
jgi:hypothetical protein